LAALGGAVFFVTHPTSLVWVMALASLPILGLQLILFRAFRRRNPLCSPRVDPSTFGAFLRECLHFFVPFMGVLIFADLVRSMTGMLDSAETLARLKNCMGLSSLAFVALGAVPRAILPAFSSKSDDPLVLRAGFLGLLKYAGFFNFLMFVIMTRFGPYIVPVLYGSKYPAADVRPLMVLLALGSFFEGFRLLTDPALQGTGHVRKTGAIEAVRVAVFVAAGLIVIPRLPGIGVGYAFCGVTLLSWLLRLGAIHRWVALVPVWRLAGLLVIVVSITAFAILEWPVLFWAATAMGVAFQLSGFSRVEIRTIRDTVGQFAGRWRKPA
jgi:O-antigen/teichoic acid export membrane protein